MHMPLGSGCVQRSALAGVASVTTGTGFEELLQRGLYDILDIIFENLNYSTLLQ